MKVIHVFRSSRKKMKSEKIETNKYKNMNKNQSIKEKSYVLRNYKHTHNKLLRKMRTQILSYNYPCVEISFFEKIV